jgi:hypothetical protein
MPLGESNLVEAFVMVLDTPSISLLWCWILPPFQNVVRFGFSRFIVFAMHLDITYVQVHIKIYESRKVKMTYILERREYLLFGIRMQLGTQWCFLG